MGDGCMTGMVKCKQCGEVMHALDFNEHDDCPASVGPPHKGESWNNYKARADAFTAKWRETKCS